METIISSLFLSKWLHCARRSAVRAKWACQGWMLKRTCVLYRLPALQVTNTALGSDLARLRRRRILLGARPFPNCSRRKMADGADEVPSIKAITVRDGYNPAEARGSSVITH